ncbi:nucleotidyltransferase substrate binding protein [Candidatus Babeliales bacterium]|nr:nucleotidyltransferase substrate binding protein [Candidatus Babeliales bacterium]
MAKIAVKYKNLCNALTTLETAIDILAKIKETATQKYDPEMAHNIELGLRDSTIQRFEYTIESLWKYLKDYSEYKFASIPDIYAPKPVIRSSCQINLISEKEANLLMEMVDYRNNTSHLYKEEVAEILSGKIVHYYPVLERIVKRTKP